mmetsp:Transcript_18171/g.39677  ORF Transcript_18171/g.39677 Transcript_18171/m.39677 type:complete len:149 (-) Transcript_18171:24-470(-)
MKRSQVKEKLRFRYDDIDKIPTLVAAIKKEIKAACPKLVLDNSRPFRVHWRGYDDDNVYIVVDTHHDIPPMTNDYYDNREKVLVAIAKAAKQNGMKFALPSKISLKETVRIVEGQTGGFELLSPNGAGDEEKTSRPTSINRTNYGDIR